MKKMHLAIISTIRSRSVAVLRVFQNTCHYDKTYHEPLTGIYSSQSYPHICKDWLSENRFTEVEDVVDLFRQKQRILFKDMAFASQPCLRFPNTQFLLLFRNPSGVFASLSLQLDTKPDMDVLKDVCGYKSLIDIYHLLKQQGSKPMLMCTDDVKSCDRGFQMHLPTITGSTSPEFFHWSRPFDAHDYKKPRYVLQWHEDAIWSKSFHINHKQHKLPKHMLEVQQHLINYFEPHYRHLLAECAAQK